MHLAYWVSRLHDHAVFSMVLWNRTSTTGCTTCLIAGEEEVFAKCMKSVQSSIVKNVGSYWLVVIILIRKINNDWITRHSWIGFLVFFLFFFHFFSSRSQILILSSACLGHNAYTPRSLSMFLQYFYSYFTFLRVGLLPGLD